MEGEVVALALMGWAIDLQRLVVKLCGKRVRALAFSLVSADRRPASS